MNTQNTLVKDLTFSRSYHMDGEDILDTCRLIAKTPYGVKVVRISVLDRMTGFGHRDIETGFRELDNRFWLVSGDFDIRYFPDLSATDAINKIKAEANNGNGQHHKKCFPINRESVSVPLSEPA
jgi:hypothetical protein